MVQQDEFEAFRRKVDKARNDRCDEATFHALSEQALALYTSQPQFGEAIAGQMTDLWHHNRESWQSTVMEEVGQLFADLDVPLAHVAGGELRARKKWRAVERHLNDDGRTDTSPDRRP